MNDKTIVEVGSINDDPLAQDMRSFSESQRKAKKDAEEAGAAQRASDYHLIGIGDAAFNALKAAVEYRTDRFNASAPDEHKVERMNIGQTLTIRIHPIEVNLR